MKLNSHIHLISAYEDDNIELQNCALNSFKSSAWLKRQLIVLLKDEDSCFRTAAIELLGDVGTRDALDPIIALLVDQDSKIASASFNSLLKFYDGSIKNRITSMDRKKILKAFSNNINSGTTCNCLMQNMENIILQRYSDDLERKEFDKCARDQKSICYLINHLISNAISYESIDFLIEALGSTFLVKDGNPINVNYNIIDEHIESEETTFMGTYVSEDVTIFTKYVTNETVSRYRVLYPYAELSKSILLTHFEKMEADSTEYSNLNEAINLFDMNKLEEKDYSIRTTAKYIRQKNGKWL